MKLLQFEKPLEILLKERSRWKEYGRNTKDLDELIKKQLKEIYKNLTAYQIVQIARHVDRPQPVDYIKKLFSQFVELHGDRVNGDDPALIGGIGLFHNTPVIVMGTRKGHTVKETLNYHLGMVSSSGFRKAARLVQLASDSLNVPVVTFVDTPGAMISHESELSGQVEAIYKSISTFLNANVPTISIITGEGGGLGALGLGATDKILMLKYAYFTVMPPEAASSVLFKNLENKELMAEELSITSDKLAALNLIDEVINEPFGGAHRFKEEVFSSVETTLQSTLETIRKEPIEILKKKRFEKFRNIGAYKP